MMASKARKNQLTFRPHFKTHQSLEVAAWFREEGIECITVSSLRMAEFFSNTWDDITVAFPVNILEIKTINRLAKKIQLNLLIESVESLKFLIENIQNPIGIFIKIDVGYHRTGIIHTDQETIYSILTLIESCKQLQFIGFLTHAGHTYGCRSKEQVLTIHKTSIRYISELKKAYPKAIISIGDTPACSLADDFSTVDEIRPGNFVFYDLMQNQISACMPDQIAVALSCPIVATHSERNELVIYGGGIHFSKEFLEVEKIGRIYGRVVEQNEKGWGKIIPDMYIKSLSQEHGIVSVPSSQVGSYHIGDCLYILPVHSCMTANLMKDEMLLLN
jgi:D-serine deaminase-like pyridoxal phosphate-dependent protein